MEYEADDMCEQSRGNKILFPDRQNQQKFGF